MASRKWKKLGRRLRLLRLSTDLTQIELTNRLERHNLLIDHTLISKYERGERRPDRERLLILLRVFIESPQEANEILRLAGYNSLLPEEEISLFEGQVTTSDLGTATPGEIETGDDFASSQGSETPSHHPPRDDQRRPIREPRFDYLIIAMWLIFLEILEIWHNISNEIVNINDVNWNGVIVPIVGAVLLVIVFLLVRKPLGRALIICFSAITISVLIVTVFHNWGIIFPTFSTLGGILLGLLLFVQGPGYFWPQLGKSWPFHSLTDKFLTVRKTPEEHENAKLALILTASGTIILILVGIAMMVVLFMPPLGTHGEDQLFTVLPGISGQSQRYAARVVWAIKIILGFLMLFLIISRWWILPLLKFVFQVSTVNGSRE